MKNAHSAPPVALTIAGSDCSAGAGLQADLKTFQHFGVHGLTAATCVVSETALTVRGIHPIPVDLVADQLSLLLGSFPVSALKTGMLFSTAHVLQIASLLRQDRPAHVVIDPVMIATTGAPLLESDAISAYLHHLLPLATLATPNIPEAEILLGEKIPDAAAMEPAAMELSKRLGIAILLKGGHSGGDSADDILVDQGSAYWFCSPRISTRASHGTGCTLSAGITACLAQGYDMTSAITAAKHYVGRALSTSYSFDGAEPIHVLNQATSPFH